MRDGATPLVVAVALGSVFAGTTVALTGDLQAVRLAAALWSLASVAASVAVWRHRVGGRGFAALSALGTLALLAWHLRTLPDHPRLPELQLAAILTWAAILSAGLLRLLRVTDWGRALLAAFSLAVPLYVVDVSLPTFDLSTARWEGIEVEPDPDTGVHPRPNSAGRNLYPDDPRGYFERRDVERESWSLRTAAGTKAALELGGDSSDVWLRVSGIAPSPSPEAWQVALVQAPLAFRAGSSYAVTFEARADEPRAVGCLVVQAHEPYEPIGAYREIEIGPEWSRGECAFEAALSEENAALEVGLGESDAAVELRDVTVTEVPGGARVVPRPGWEFTVRYRFNSMGFRGPDVAIPRPPGTFRVLLLGDSYTLGVGVREEDTVAARLEEILAARARARGDTIRYEVVNAGVNGHDTRQERISFEKRASRYEPQVVILLMVFNDGLGYNDAFAQGRVASRSRLGRISTLWGYVELMRPTYRYDFSGSLEEVRRLDAASERVGAELAVATFRTNDRAPWRTLVGAATEGLRGTGIPYLDLGATLLAEGRTHADLRVHAIDGHPNEVAHRLAAEALARFLSAEGLLP